MENMNHGIVSRAGYSGVQASRDPAASVRRLEYVKGRVVGFALDVPLAAFLLLVLHGLRCSI
jgi:hypothetical protein